MGSNMKKLHGFTLLEILAVIAIIGILSVVSVGPIRGAQVRSRDAKRKADLNLIAQGLEAYYADRRGLPEQSPPNNCNVKRSTDRTPWITGLQTYIVATSGQSAVLPVDPRQQNNSSLFYTYQCFVSDPAKRYRLTATLENSNDPERDSNGQFTIER